MSENIQVPKGWEIKKLGEVAEIFRGASPRPIAKYLTNSSLGIPWIKIGDVNPNDKYIITTKEKISKDGANHSKIIHSGYFILSNSMSIGRPYISKITGCIHDGWLSISNYDKSITTDYLYYALNSQYIKKSFANNASLGTVTNLNSDIVKNTKILLPPLEEQKKIAEILSLWDKAIEQTKDLIAYKEKQKKGLMQALLTGKKRLNGFTDEWKTYSFNELCKTYAIDRNLQINSNSYLSNGIIPIVDQGNKNIAGYTNDKKYIINSKNDGYIIFGDHTRIIKFIDFDFAIGADGTKILYSSSLILNKLLFYYLKNSKITNLGYSRHFKLLKELIFIIPTSLDEQKAIADILSIADEEIELLNKQLELYTEQKKGLMQNLLTGKVRV